MAAKKDVPAEVKAACEELGDDPGQLLEFKVYPDRVVIILLDYRKYSFTLADLAGRLKAVGPPSPQGRVLKKLRVEPGMIYDQGHLPKQDDKEC